MHIWTFTTVNHANDSVECEGIFTDYHAAFNYGKEYLNTELQEIIIDNESEIEGQFYKINELSIIGTQFHPIEGMTKYFKAVRYF